MESQFCCPGINPLSGVSQKLIQNPQCNVGLRRSSANTSINGFPCYCTVFLLPSLEHLLQSCRVGTQSHQYLDQEITVFCKVRLPPSLQHLLSPCRVGSHLCHHLDQLCVVLQCFSPPQALLWRPEALFWKPQALFLEPQELSWRQQALFWSPPASEAKGLRGPRGKKAEGLLPGIKPFCQGLNSSAGV